MKAVQTLPEGYRETFTVDLQKDKKKALLINAISLGMGAAMAVGMHFVVPFQTIFAVQVMTGGRLMFLVVWFACAIAYMVLHELVHGAAMKLCGTKKIKYGFTGLYAFAGSDDYYGKKSYIFIAMAPIVLWGVVLAVINLLVPEGWFWFVYLLQICNISGAAGDLYVTVKFSKFSPNILVKDCGVGMTVYDREHV